MKNIVKCLAAVTIAFFIACESDDNGRFQSDPESGWVAFEHTATQTLLEETTTLEIPVVLNAPVNKAGLEVYYELHTVSGADPGTVVTTASPLSIEAGTLSAPIVLYIDHTATPTEDIVFDIVLTVTNSSTVSVGLSDGSQTTIHRITLLAACIASDLAGTYDSIADGDVGDGAGGAAGTYTNLPAVVTLTDMGDGVYEIDDMSFGLYPLVYGFAAPSGSIQNTCNEIIGLGDTDQFGDPFTITGTVDGETGVISLSWSNTWGDTGTVTLTPQ